MNYVVLTDSTCDLKPESLAWYNIEYAPMNYVVDGVEYPALLTWENHSAKDFYDIMRSGKRITTTQVPMQRYEEIFEKYMKNGQDVIYISCSSALSGSVNVAVNVAKDMLEKYPDRKIFCIDSLISSLGQGYLAIKASMLREEGKTIEEVVKYIEENKLKVNQYATVGSLEFLKKAGRVTASSAFFGNLFGIKPIIMSDVIGQNYAFKKVKGAMNAYNEIKEQVKSNVINPEEQTLYISHADAPKEAEILKNLIMAEVPFKDCYISYIAPIVGASVGPGTTNVYFVGKEVTIQGGE